MFLNRGQEMIWHAPFPNKNVPEIGQCKKPEYSLSKAQSHFSMSKTLHYLRM